MRTDIFIAFLALSISAGGPGSAEPFREEFNGTTLNPAFRVLNPDKGRMAVIEDALLLVTHSEAKNVIEYTPGLPARGEVIVRIEEAPSQPNQQIALRAGTGSDNARVTMHVGDYDYVYFATNKTLADEDAQQIWTQDDAMLGKPFYLRLVREGPVFEGFYSPDGSKWSSLGRQVFIAAGTNVPLALAVYNYENAPESPVRIDSFEVIPLND